MIKCSYGIRITNLLLSTAFSKEIYIVIWKSEFAGDAGCRGGAIFADYSKNLYIVNNSFVPRSYLFSNIYGVHLVMVEDSLVLRQ